MEGLESSEGAVKQETQVQQRTQDIGDASIAGHLPRISAGMKWCWSKDEAVCTKGSRFEGLTLFNPLGTHKVTLLMLDMEVNYLMFAMLGFVFCCLVIL